MTSSTISLEQTTLTLVKRVLRDYVRPHLWRVAAAFVCMSVMAGCAAAFTQLLKPIINDIFVARDADMLTPIALAALVVFTAKGVATFGQAVLMAQVGNRIVADMQTELFDSLMDADLAYYHRTSPGSLISRFINDLALLRRGVTETMTGFGKDSLTLIALVGVMFYEDWLLALIAIVGFPTAVLPIVRIGKRMRKVSGNTQIEVGRLTTLLDEVFQGFRHVKAYGMENYERGRARRSIDEVYRLYVKGEITRSILSPIMEFLGGLAIVTMILYGGHQVIFGDKTTGAFFAFMVAFLLAYEPFKRLAKLNAKIQEALAAADRIFTLIDAEPSIRERPDAKRLEVTGGGLRFEGVSFAYDAGKGALNDVSIEARSGQTVALVGPSGAGKSTMLNLLPRFYDVDEGRVTIDGQDIRDVTFESLRGQIALVSQEILLFDDTIGANIAYGKRDAPREEIEAAARHAGAHDFISELPQGYDTLVGPRGVRLSGGQRQRVAIARAMLKNAPILLLDEATSALDTESERHVQRALKVLMTGRTTLVIAHRLSTVADADIIYVLDGGRVIEQGSHDELLARGGAYARLYSLQFFGEEGEDSDPAAVERLAAEPPAKARVRA